MFDLIYVVACTHGRPPGPTPVLACPAAEAVGSACEPGTGWALPGAAQHVCSALLSCSVPLCTSSLLGTYGRDLRGQRESRVGYTCHSTACRACSSEIGKYPLCDLRRRIQPARLYHRGALRSVGEPRRTRPALDAWIHFTGTQRFPPMTIGKQISGSVRAALLWSRTLEVLNLGSGVSPS